MAKKVLPWVGLPLALAAAVLAYIPYTAYQLRAQAASLAGREPYCVQVPKGREYRPLLGMEGARDLFMQGNGGHHHAVLAVGNLPDPVTYHWSYLRNRFVKGTYGPMPVVCAPLRDYVANPARFREDGRLHFALLGRHLAIPRRLRPQPEWPGSMVGYSIRAAAPWFTRSDDDCPDRACDLVFIAFLGDAVPRPLYPDEAARFRAGDVGHAHGLVHMADASTDHYLEVAQDGAVLTDISCLRAPNAGCLHRHADGETKYSFHHQREDLPQWRAMHGRLARLHAGFQLAPAAD